LIGNVGPVEGVLTLVVRVLIGRVWEQKSLRS